MEPPSARTGADRYLELLDLWEAARKAAGGKLTQAEEAEHAAEIDSVWMGLSDDEQIALEARLIPGRHGKAAT